ncbi:hypothetical protein [Sphingopyxis indica]|nr:hypothetical protein [Sphingopyxis indica]
MALLGASLSLGVAMAAQTGAAPERPDFTRMTDAELLSAFADAAQRKETDFCGFLVPLYWQMEMRGSFNPNVKYMRAAAEMSCAVSEERWTDAYQKLKYVRGSGKIELDRIASINIAALAGDRAAASADLIAFLDSPEAEGQTEPLAQTARNLFHSHRQAKDYEGLLALMRGLDTPGHLASFSEDMQISIKSDHFTAEVEAGHPDRAIELVDQTVLADSVIDVLGDRRFEKYWPQLEAKAGLHLQVFLEAELRRAVANYQSQPDKPGAIRSLALAYLRNGRFEEVVALLDKHQPSDFTGLSEDMGWALNAKVYALDALGRHDAAGDIFDRIVAQADDPSTSAWMVNFAINRGERLVDLGQYERGLEAAELAGRIAEEGGNGYARMLVRRAKLCALTALGREGEAKAVMMDVEQHLADSAPVAAAAMLCGGAEDRAAEIVRNELNDRYRAMPMIRALQKQSFDLYGTSSVTPSLALRVRPRADVAPVFERVARDIPLEYAPAFGTRREELAAHGGNAVPNQSQAATTP